MVLQLNWEIAIIAYARLLMIQAAPLLQTVEPERV